MPVSYVGWLCVWSNALGRGEDRSVHGHTATGVIARESLAFNFFGHGVEAECPRDKLVGVQPISEIMRDRD